MHLWPSSKDLLYNQYIKSGELVLHWISETTMKEIEGNEWEEVPEALKRHYLILFRQCGDDIHKMDTGHFVFSGDTWQIVIYWGDVVPHRHKIISRNFCTGASLPLFSRIIMMASCLVWFKAANSWKKKIEMAFACISFVSSCVSSKKGKWMIILHAQQKINR